MSDEQSPKNDNEKLAAIRLIETQKTARVITISVATCICMAILVSGYVVVHKTPWELLLAACIAPGGVLAFMLKIHQRYVDKEHRRTVALEKHRDPQRSSSNEMETSNSVRSLEIGTTDGEDS